MGLQKIIIHILIESDILVILFLLDFNATTVMPSFGFRFNNSAHSYKGLFIKYAIPSHNNMKNQLTVSGNDEDAEISVA